MIHTLAAIVAYATPQPWPYPSHPAGARTYVETGVLTAVDLGNHNGSITILPPDGTSEDVFIGVPFRVNGRRYVCHTDPSVRFGYRHDGCDERRPIVVGATRVRVWYWRPMFENRPAKITDEIDTVKVTPKPSRKGRSCIDLQVDLSVWIRSVILELPTTS